MDSVAFAELAARQAQIITTAQWRDAGGSPSRLRAQLAAGRWRALNELVVCLHNGPLTPDQAEWAAVSSAQQPAALASCSGMSRWGVTGFAADRVHVLVQRGAKVLPVAGVAVVVHESRRFTEADVVRRLPPLPALERCVIDAASWAPDLWTAFRIAIAPVQQRKSTANRLRATLDAQGRIRFARQLRLFLDDVTGGASALSEVEFLRWCRRHALPTPRLQVRVDVRGRRRYLDAWFACPDGGEVWVEVDGGVHLQLATRWEDVLKDNDAVLAGRAAIRLMSSAIYADDPRALRQLRQAISSGLVRSSRRHGDVTV